MSEPKHAPKTTVTLDGLVDRTQVAADAASVARAAGARLAAQVPSGVTGINAVARSSPVAATAALGKAAPVIGAAGMGLEAIQNTRTGWGEAIEKQDQRAGNRLRSLMWEGLANPLTSIANSWMKHAEIYDAWGKALASNREADRLAVQLEAARRRRFRQLHPASVPSAPTKTPAPTPIQSIRPWVAQSK